MQTCASRSQSQVGQHQTPGTAHVLSVPAGTRRSCVSVGRPVTGRSASLPTPLLSCGNCPRACSARSQHPGMRLPRLQPPRPGPAAAASLGTTHPQTRAQHPAPSRNRAIPAVAAGPISSKQGSTGALQQVSRSRAWAQGSRRSSCPGARCWRCTRLLGVAAAAWHGPKRTGALPLPSSLLAPQCGRTTACCSQSLVKPPTWRSCALL